MRGYLFFFFVATAAAVGTFTGGDPKTGPFCCNEGTPDPSGTCKAMGLNSYACESFRRNDASGEDSIGIINGDKGGCDNGVVSNYPFGRDVKGFVANSKDSQNLGPNIAQQTFLGFIGCAV
ncbi:hypothetical protein LZ31DRAFT_1248 [Colletotrichum somersetense]|nr:hypothetical protein LZ31DRAFT_1248 [Colletotrichum somersetense]